MELRSGFAKWISSLLDFRVSVGLDRHGYEKDLRRFDSYCSTYHPKESALTEEVVRGWLAFESSRGYLSPMPKKAAELRSLANYIRAFGGEAYVLPYRSTPLRTSPVPHILNDAELASLFRSIDIRATKHCYLAVRGAHSVLFRLIYTCGLRPQEGRLAKTADLDLANGRLFLRNTKGHSERIVVLSPQMVELLTKYTRRLVVAAPGSEYLFPKKNGAVLSAYALGYFFKKSWRKADINANRRDVPHIRAYDLRHRFASTMLQKWVDCGRNLYSALPILRAYMGHASITATLYYVHLLPENLRRSPKVDWEKLNAIIPEV